MFRRKKKVIKHTYSQVAQDIATIILKKHVYAELPRYRCNGVTEYSVDLGDEKIICSVDYTVSQKGLNRKLIQLDRIDTEYLHDLASTKYNEQEKVRKAKVRKIEQQKMEETFSVIADIAQSIRVEGELNE